MFSMQVGPCEQSSPMGREHWVVLILHCLLFINRQFNQWRNYLDWLVTCSITITILQDVGSHSCNRDCKDQHREHDTHVGHQLIGPTMNVLPNNLLEGLPILYLLHRALSDFFFLKMAPKEIFLPWSVHPWAARLLISHMRHGGMGVGLYVWACYYLRYYASFAVGGLWGIRHHQLQEHEGCVDCTEKHLSCH